MKRILASLLLVASCASSKPVPDVGGDSPSTTEQTSPEERESTAKDESAPKGEIDLGFEGDYGSVELEDGKTPPAYVEPPRDGNNYRCKVAAECEDRRLPMAQGRTGEWFCVQKTCVPKYDEPQESEESTDEEETESGETAEAQPEGEAAGEDSDSELELSGEEGDPEAGDDPDSTSPSDVSE